MRRTERLRPLGNRIVVEPVRAADEEMRGGLYVPDQAKEKPTRGRVLAVGPGRVSEDGTLIPVQGVEEGDTVMFGKYAGFEFEMDGMELRSISEPEILGVVESAL